jgi:urease accessory protein
VDTKPLLALLHLSSPALPIGGYSYSQCFETAVDLDIVHDEASACRWIEDQLNLVMAPCEAPVWSLLFKAWSAGDLAGVCHWNDWFRASRETRELRQETEQMGWSLSRLASDLGWGCDAARSSLRQLKNITLPAAHAFAACALEAEHDDALSAYVFSWIENQVMAAIKTVPLGQMAGQRILNRSRQRIPAVITQAVARASGTPAHLCSLAPQLAIMSSRHETQYSRLFRS